MPESVGHGTVILFLVDKASFKAVSTAHIFLEVVLPLVAGIKRAAKAFKAIAGPSGFIGT